jgi:hypothetical protein
MSKAISYYDWELTFKRNNSPQDEDTIIGSKSFNALGIPEGNFKEFISKWKEKNLV